MATAGVVAGVPLLGAGIGHAGQAPTGPDHIPPDTRPGDGGGGG